MNKPYPFFLKYFKEYCRNLSPTEAHQQFIRSISYLYTWGYAFEDVVKMDDIYNCSAYINAMLKSESQDDRQTHFPHAETIVQYVWTRDEVINPFGPWIEMDFFDPLYIANFADHLKQEKQSTVSTQKLAGLIFSILGISPRLNWNNHDEKLELLEQALYKDIFRETTLIEKEKLSKLIRKYQETNDIAAIASPNGLYSFAGISSQSFRKYSDIIEIDPYFEKYNVGGFKVRLWIANVRQLLDKYEQYKKDYRLTVQTKDLLSDAKYNATLGYDKSDRTFTKMLNNYNTRFLRDKSSYFQLPALKDNPLIRVKKRFDAVTIAFQKNLVDYPLLMFSLYNKASEAIKCLVSKSIIKTPATSLVKLRENLVENNMSNTLKPIGQPDIVENDKRHFEQIQESSRVIHLMSKHGIRIDISRTVQLLKAVERMLKYIEQASTRNTISYDLLIDGQIKLTDDENEINNEVRYSGITNFDKYKRYHSSLKKFLAVASDLRAQSPYDRIRGQFTTHGASTHRMTCRDINLQGIPEKLRTKLYTASEGHSLISADVSGQDVTIAANVADRIYRTIRGIDEYPKQIIKSFSEKEIALLNKNEIVGNQERISQTLYALSNGNSSNPVTHITDLILYAEREVNNDTLRSIVRKKVKTAIYLILYGGGFSTKSRTNNHIISGLVKEFCDKVYSPTLEVFRHIPGKANYRENFTNDLKRPKRFYDEASINLNHMLHILEQYNIQPFTNNIYSLAEYYSDQIDNLENDLDEFGFILSWVDDLVREQYPGLLESFPYLTLYYKIHGHTFPSLLGWKTIVDPNSIFSPNIITRSRSYVIQASGAEFIRQWLIELGKLNACFNRWFIVNAVHDQVLIEAPKGKWEEFVIKEMVPAAKKAARAIGIDPSTMNIPPPEAIAE